MTPGDSLESKWRRLHFGWGRHLPVLLQTEAAECGLACLAMILGYYGHLVDLSTLRRQFAFSQKGATLKTIMSTAQDLHLETRALRLDMDEIASLRTPCILHWSMNHFVVLKKTLRNHLGVLSGAIIHDPSRGEVKVGINELSKCFTGVALELTPNYKFAAKEERRRINFFSMLGSVVGIKRSMVQILIMAIALQILSLISPFFMQWVVDDAILSSDQGLLHVLVFAFALLMFIQTGLGLVRSWAVLYMSTHLGMQWVSKIFTHLIHLPMSYFEKRHLGDVVSRFGSISTIQRSITTNLIEAFIDGLLAVATLGMMLAYSAKLSLIVLGSLVVYGILRFASYGPLQRATEQQIVLQAREQTIFMESIRAVQSIKLFNKEYDRRSRWLDAVVGTINRGLTTQKMSMGFSTAHTFVEGVENLAVVWIGAELVMSGSFSLGMLFAFMSYKGTFVGRVYSLIDKFFDLKMLSIQSDRLADIVFTEPEANLYQPMGDAANEARSTRDPTHLAPSFVPIDDFTLEIAELSFRYASSEPWIIDKLNLTIEQGEFVALVGPSGCGKTTLIKLLVGLLTASSGDISIGGSSMKSIGTKAYRDMIGVVMQEDQLLTGTIAENICFFDSSPDQLSIEACARLAMIDAEIRSMPMGYMTLLGDMGSSLSGGQRQRVLLARALYKKPKILFLDEATSHLDLANEARIAEAIRNLSITRVVVAHRPETIKSANRVIDLSGVSLSDISGSLVAQSHAGTLSSLA
jgi:ATP-binding cassette subfamily B protein RaxB